MKNIKLNIPVIVQTLSINDSPSFHIKPAFIPHPIATNRRFELAIRQFKKEIKYYFKGFEINRENFSDLGWYMFAPKLHFQQVRYSNMISKQLIEGRINTISFELQGKHFVCLPNFNYAIFIVEENDFGECLNRFVTQRFKAYKKEFGRDVEFEPFFSNKKEFLSTVEVQVNIQYDTFRYEKSQSNPFFSTFNDNSEFIGAVEVEKVGYDLNSLFPNELNRAYFQDKMVARLFDLIYSKENNPIVLVGKTGVGKHTILQEVVYRYLQDKQENVSEKGKYAPKIWNVDPTQIISGMSIIGMWQKRLESIIEFIQKPNPNSKTSDKILIDNVVALTRIGKSAQNNMGLSDLFKPYIEKRTLQVILIATPEEWKVLQEINRSFSDLFQVIRMSETDVETTTNIILEKRKKLESDNDCQISIQAIKQLLSIQRNYLKQEALPGSILNLLEKLSVKYRNQSIDAEDIRKEFNYLSGLKSVVFDTGITFEPHEVKTILSKQLVGQPAAVEALSDVIHLIKAKLNHPDKPNASLMLIGPTGVGKTQAAKVLAKYLLGSEDYLLRFDMNEYIDEYAIQRLIGSYDHPEGILTGKVRYRPFGVILLDEIEKAHPKVHDLLLQVLDDGRLTDSLGRTVDFTNTIIIMTSNIGAKEVSKQLGFEKRIQDQQAIYRKAVEKQFRPEFINRIEKIVIFKPLSVEHIYGIARLQIKELLQRDGFVRRSTILNISSEALEWVANRGYNAQMGGRALKRQIEKDLTTLSAEQLLLQQGEEPIILEISIQNKQLTPVIQTLQFTEALPAGWLPELPHERKGRRFFTQLLRQLEQVEHQIRRKEDQETASDMITINESSRGDLNWEMYTFKERISSCKQRIQTLMLGFRDNFYAERPAIPLRFKVTNLVPRSINYSKGNKENIKDKLFQQEAMLELTESHSYSSNRFDSLETEFLDSYLDVQFIQLFSDGFLSDQTDDIEIQIHSCVHGSGEKEIQFMMDYYEHLLTQLELDFTIQKDRHLITANGYTLYQLLKGEAGIHLFYQSHQNPLPIKINIKDVSNGWKEDHYNVIRVYDKTTTLLDLRTQFSNEIPIRFPELKLLLFAGISNQ